MKSWILLARMKPSLGGIASGNVSVVRAGSQLAHSTQAQRWLCGTAQYRRYLLCSSDNRGGMKRHDVVTR